MYDSNYELMNKFKNFNLDFNEKSLLQKFKKYRSFYDLNNNIKNLNKCNLIFISLDVKTNNNNIADYSEILKYINLLNKKIKKKFLLSYKVNCSQDFAAI